MHNKVATDVSVGTKVRWEVHHKNCAFPFGDYSWETGIVIANTLRQGNQVIVVERDDDLKVEAKNVNDVEVVDGSQEE